jgi:hypothetical protein
MEPYLRSHCLLGDYYGLVLGLDCGGPLEGGDERDSVVVAGLRPWNCFRVDLGLVLLTLLYKEQPT